MRNKWRNNEIVKNLQDIDSISIFETLSLTTWFFFKRMFSTSLWWVLIFLIPSVLLIGGGVFIPYMYAFSFLFGAALLFSTIIIYGALFYPIYNSSIYSNMELTVLKFVSIYISLILTTICIDILIIFYMTTLYITLVQLQIVFQFNWIWYINASYEMHWSDIWWSVFVYFLFVSIILDIAISFFVQSISKTSKTYYIISYTYFFIFVAWSGALTICVPISLDENGEIMLNDNIHYANNYFFWMRWFNPNYGINTFAFSTFAAGTWNPIKDTNPALTGLEQTNPWAWTDDKIWNYCKFISIIYGFFIFYCSLFVNYIKYKRS